jgi:hypothetical protein
VRPDGPFAPLSVRARPGPQPGVEGLGCAGYDDKLNRLERTRLAREYAKLDPAVEQTLADESLVAEADPWPEY